MAVLSVIVGSPMAYRTAFGTILVFVGPFVGLTGVVLAAIGADRRQLREVLVTLIGVGVLCATVLILLVGSNPGR